MNRIIQANEALFHEHHERHTRDRFCHGIDTENRVFPQGRVALAIGKPYHRGVDGFPTASDCEQCTCELSGLDVPFCQKAIDALKPCRRKTGVFYLAHDMWVSSWAASARRLCNMIFKTAESLFTA